MIKRLSSVALALLAIASPVHANEIEDYIYSNVVLKEVYRSGTTIKFKDPSCERPILGSYTHKTDVMVICLANHRSFPQLADTIRHETVHIMQRCLGRPIMSFQEVANVAQPTDYQFMKGYSNHSHHHELEANIAARELSDQQIVKSFKEICYS